MALVNSLSVLACDGHILQWDPIMHNNCTKSASRAAKDLKEYKCCFIDVI